MSALIVFGATYLIHIVALGAAGVLAWRLSRGGQGRLLWLLAISLPLGYALARIAGLLFTHEQPFVAGGFEPLIPHPVDNAFPSDHTVIAGVFASVAFFAERRAGLVLWALTLLLGLSRVFAGLHYAVDIIASAALAVCAVWVAELILRRVAPGVGTGQL